ncbi:cation diffusion facilitator family transporter [Indiicoccus explosivorum]|uniref:cation diffusion facilitator family transporter n=1 Tax=Indiicoccus explosivorum TaxID=1917864 RepID=UPI000B4509ED|nr:cation diffusion facilitator family transporter [Indiicoccus explosivorum]
MEQYANLRKGEKGAWLSIGAYLFLSAVKLTAGYAGDSEALRADGFNNLSDIIASVAVLIGLRISQRPPDMNHHYGHLRAETVSSLFASFIMGLIGLQVLYSAFVSLLDPAAEAPSLFTAGVAFFSAVIIYAVYRYNLKLSRQINSAAVRAAAYDNRSDALVSIGAGIGIVAAALGAPILDSITAAAVALIILKTAADIFREAAHALTDGFDEEEMETLTFLIKKVPGVLALRDFKGRTHGNLTLVDLTVEVDPALDVVQSHRITEEIERKIHRVNAGCVVHVHIEPHYPEKTRPD